MWYSLNRGELDIGPKYYNPYYRNLEKGTPNFREPSYVKHAAHDHVGNS